MIEIPLRAKYRETRARRYKKRDITNHKPPLTLHEALHEAWIETKAGKALHEADEVRQAQLRKKRYGGWVK